MDIREVRRRNLNTLMEREFHGIRGAQSRLAEKLGKPQNFISRCLAEPGKAGAKTIGEDFAREIEIAFGLDRYSMDSLLQRGIADEPTGCAPDRESNVIAADFSPGDIARRLLGRVTPRSRKVVERLIELDAQGRLSETDIVLLESLIERFGKDG